MDIFAANIDYWRRLRKIKIKRLMDACGIVGRGTWNRHVEEMTMPVEELIIIARELGTTPSELLKGVK